jgi:hypothetical protein
MEGFIYLTAKESPYPVYQGTKNLDNFPIIPIGMLDLWRKSNDEPWEF